MSGVLDRMVLRARGTLPVVEPLVAPRYAQTAPSGLAETPVEREAAVRAAGEKRRRIEPARPDAADDGVEKRTERAVLAAAQESARTVAGTPVEGKERPAPERAPKPDADLRRAQKTSAAKRNSGETERQGRMARDPVKAEPGQAAIPEGGEKDRAQDGEERGARIGNRAASQPEPVIERAVIESARAARREMEAHTETTAQRKMAAHPEPLSAPAEQHTEIHISIGHIELRAPRTEAKPQTAAFRPRVTLDEFLHGKREAGA